MNERTFGFYIDGEKNFEENFRWLKKKKIDLPEKVV